MLSRDPYLARCIAFARNLAKQRAEEAKKPKPKRVPKPKPAPLVPDNPKTTTWDGLTRGQPWDRTRCTGPCKLRKDRSEFYSSSGRRCKNCHNLAAREKRAKEALFVKNWKPKR